MDKIVRKSVSKQHRNWILESQNPLVEKKGHFFTEKDSAWQVLADSEQIGESLQVYHLGPASMDPFNL